MTTVPITEALANEDFDYQEEKPQPARTTQEAVVIIKQTREILIGKQTPGYALYSRVARIMFLISFLCVLVVIGGTVWFAYELVSSAHVLHQIQTDAIATSATR